MQLAMQQGLRSENHHSGCCSYKFRERRNHGSAAPAVSAAERVGRLVELRTADPVNVEQLGMREIFRGISTPIIFIQSVLVIVFNRKAVAKFEDLSVHYHPLKMLLYCRPFGERILC